MTEGPSVYNLLSRAGQAIDDEEQARAMSFLMTEKPDRHMVYTWDDIGMSSLLTDLYGDSIRYCPQDSDWYAWDGCRWSRQIDSGLVSDKLQSLLNLLLLYCDEIEAQDRNEDMSKYRKYIRGARKNSSMKGIIEVLKSMCRISANQFDSDPYLLNTPGAAYDLRTLRVIQNRNDRNLTQVTTCNPEFDSNYECDRWYRFIDEIMSGDGEKAAFLQRALGYSILGVNREECMFIALGSQTRNGKGTLFSSILNVLGKEYAQGSDPALICETRNGKSIDFNSPQPALRKLTNCRLVAMSEAQKDVRLDSAAMKAMTGRDTLTTRGLYESSFDFVPQFTLWLNTNYLPQVNDDTVFKSDRIWVIKFDAFFDASKRDLDLKQIFADQKNKPTILRWLIDGCRDYMLHGLKVPECVREATQEYRERYDRIGSFLREMTRRTPTGAVVRGDLYAVYRTWCTKTENHFAPVGSTTFYGDLATRGYPIERVNGEYCVTGIVIEQAKPGIITLT